MAKDLEFEASKLYGFYDALSQKKQVSLLKSAIRRCAKKLKAAAEQELFTSVNSTRPTALKKGIWVDVYSRTAGFRVSVAGKKGMTPYRGKERKVPLLIWLEDGTTSDRKTRQFKGNTHIHANRGGISKPRLFLKKAEDRMRSSISDELETEFLTVVRREAKKYGCEV